MSTPEPTITIQLGCASVVEWANLAPHIQSPNGWFQSSILRQVERNVMRKMAVEVVPFPLDLARHEVELEAEKHQARMAAVPAVSARIRSLVEQSEATDCPHELARIVLAIRDAGSNVCIR